MLGLLRRIAKALERANELEKFRIERDYPPLAAAPPAPRMAEISQPTVAQWNERYRSRGIRG
jgi:hypothetical protein